VTGKEAKPRSLHGSAVSPGHDIQACGYSINEKPVRPTDLPDRNSGDDFNKRRKGKLSYAGAKVKISSVSSSEIQSARN
jgi:hypothetical protein